MMTLTINALWNNLTIKNSETLIWNNKNLDGLLAHVDEGLHVYVEKFNTEQDANEFVALFPKFVKVAAHRVLNVGGDDHFMVDFYVRWTCKQTGTHNEAGMKRAKKFIEIIKTYFS